MNLKKRIITILSLSLCFSAGFFSKTVHAAPSDWALQEVNDAAKKGLVTTKAATNYQKNMTREDFCELVVLMAEKSLGKTLDTDKTPFTDVSNIAISKAYNYGIVEGMSEKTFAPNKTVTREQMVVMMVRAIKKMELEKNKVVLKPATTFPFSDSSSVSNWALDSLKIGYSNKIIFGDNNRIYPLNPITSQECIIIVSRSYDKVFDSFNDDYVVEEPNTDQQYLNSAIDNIYISYSTADFASSVTKNITLPVNGSNGVTITWQSSNSNIISKSGAVTLPKDNDTTVTLTATATKGTLTKTKTFNLTVKKTAVVTGNVSLRNVTIGQTKSELLNNTGSPNRTISVSSGESWLVYHDGSYNSFFIVSVSNDTVSGVYTVGNSFDLKNNGVSTTVDSLKGISGIKVSQFNDSNDGNKTYAMVLSNTNNYSSVSSSMSGSYSESELSYAMFEITNAFRAFNGRTSLKWNDKLGVAMQKHAEDMNINNYMDHTGKDGSSPSDRGSAQGYKFTTMGENIHSGYTNPVYSVNGWVNSNGHRSNMLNNSFTEIGCGISSGYSGQLFGKPYGDTSSKPSSVATSQTSITIKKGATYTLYTTPTPSNATITNYKWESSSPTVASISQSGKNFVTILGKSAGTTEIYFYCDGPNSQIYTKCTVIVEDTSILMKSIKQDPNNLLPTTLYVGDSANIRVVFEPLNATNPNLKYESSNQGVVSFNSSSSPYLIAKSEGKSTIRVSSVDGNAYFDFDITVVSKKPVVDPDLTSVTSAIDSLYITYAEGDFESSVTKNITLPVYGSDSVNIVWQSSNTNIVSELGVVTLPTDNDTPVTLTATATKGAIVKTKTFNVIVKKAAVAESVSLNNVTIGQTESELLSNVGSPSRTINVSSNESWLIYHDGSYNSFFIVSVSNDTKTVSGVYAVGNSFDLKSNGMSVSADSLKNISSVRTYQFKDSNDGNRDYAMVLNTAGYSSGVSSSMSGSYSESELSYAMFEITNAFRAFNGVYSLQWNDKLGVAMQKHAQDMNTNNYFDHTSKDGRSPADRGTAEGYQFRMMGENIHGGYINPIFSVDGWVNSTGHRSNMLNTSFTEIGCGISAGYSGQLFGSSR